MRKLSATLVGMLVGSGMGHLAYGRYRRGGAFLVAEGALWGTMIASALGCRSSMLWSTLGALVLFRLFSVVDLFITSRHVAAPPAAARVLAVWAALFAIGGFQAHVIRRDLVEAFQIPSGSMLPTVHVGDHLFIDKRARTPQRGAVIVYTTKDGTSFLKRVVAVGGDTVEISGSVIKVNGHTTVAYPKDDDCRYTELDAFTREREERACSSAYETRDDGRSYRVIYSPGNEHQGQTLMTVPAGTLYLLGDNRDNSNDSRFLGSVPLDAVKGTALFVWFAWSDGKLLRDRIGTIIE